MSERRLAAIMFTDIVGYTAMMGSDEVLAFNVMQKNREIHQQMAKKYKGDLIKEMGDGMLLSFHLATNAVRCGIEIQQSCQKQKIPLKIGIHAGEMVFEEKDVLGDGVNIASRIQEIAPSGRILISASVYRDVKNKGDIRVAFFREQLLKNVDEPLKIYNVELKDENIGEKSSEVTNQYPKKSIAVLPFVNMSNDSEQEYFCDGMSEEIINALTQVENIKVIARTSAFEFKNKNVDIRKIGNQLNVSHIVEGSVRKSGNRLRITAQLINVSDGVHLWSERYDREMTDIFKVQDEIALAIVDNLKIRLFEGERENVTRNKTQNLDAYHLYLKGLFHLNKRSKEGMSASIGYFEKAIKLDPNYVLAYTGIANAYIALTDWGEIKPIDGQAKANAILQKAIQLDDQLAEIYFAYTYLNICEWNLKDFNTNFQKTIKLNPRLPHIYHIKGISLAILGHFEAAIAHNKKAREMDPLSMIFNFACGLILFYSGQRDKAIQYFNKALIINPHFFPAHIWSMYVYILDGRDYDAVREIQKALSIHRQNQQLVLDIEEIYEKTGLKGFLTWMIQHGITFYERPFNHFYHKAVMHSMLGQKEEAFANLKVGFEQKSFRVAFTKYEPGFKKIQSDRRFSILVKNIGIWVDK